MAALARLENLKKENRIVAAVKLRIRDNFAKDKNLFNVPKEEQTMKQHRFWAWGAVICMIMVMITGYKHK